MLILLTFLYHGNWKKLLFLFKINLNSVNKCLLIPKKMFKFRFCCVVVCFSSSEILSEAIWKFKQSPLFSFATDLSFPDLIVEPKELEKIHKHDSSPF